MSVVIDTNVEWVDVDQDEPQTDLPVVDDPQPEPMAVTELSDSEPEQELESKASEVVDDQRASDDFRTRIWNAEMRCRGKEAIVEDLKEQLKFAKADYEESVSALRKLANECHQPSMPLFDHANKVEAEAEAVVEVADESQDDSWRERPLLSLFQMGVIEGLGQKKMEVLTDLCPTFGHFEDLRASASLEGKQLKEVLPKGFGEKITDQIEELFLNAITQPMKTELKVFAEDASETTESIDLEDL